MSLDEMIKQQEDELEKFVIGANAQIAERRGRIAGLKMALEISKPIVADPVEDLPHDTSVEA